MQKKVIITIFIIILVGIGFYLFTRNNSATPTQINSDQEASAFTITTIEGKTVSSDSLRGKVVVISSAAQWCATCQEEAREFVPVYQKYQEKPVVFITIDIDPNDTIASIEQFRKTYSTPWDYADASGGAEMIQKYSMNRFEMTFIIDKNGVIRYSGDVLTHPDILDAEIQKLL